MLAEAAEAPESAEEEAVPLAGAPVASGDFDDFRASRPGLLALLSRRCAERSSAAACTEGLEAELDALRERLYGSRLLMDTLCYELCDGWRLRREAQDFRDCQAMSADRRRRRRRC
jgi:hypothetical protein